MRRVLLAACAAVIGIAAAAQITPIPWHPKLKKPVSPTAKTAQAPPPAPGPKTYRMTFDKTTTVSPGVFLAEGNVRFVYGTMFLTADSVTYDSNKGTLRATGQVAVDFENFTLSGSVFTYDLNAGKGSMADAFGVQKEGDFTVIGDTIRKIGKDWFEVEHGIFTSCSAAVPPWSMRVSKAKFHVDHYAFLTNPRFRIRNVPVIYLPYLVWPIKPERSTGLLIPEIGSSTSKGFTVNTALFIAPADWWDDTLYVDAFSEEGVGIGEEFRYVPSRASYGWFHGYFIRQKSDRRKRWDFTWTHIQNMRKGWYFVGDVHLLSDVNFLRDYQRDYDKGTISGTDSRLFLVRNWGPYSFTARAERRLQYFTQDGDLVQKMLPGVEWRSSLQPLGGGLYFGFESSLAALHKEWAEYDTEPRKFSLSYGRLDLHPSFEWPLHPAPWLDATPRLSLRATGYSESLDEESGEYDGGRLWRGFVQGSLDVTGPRFTRTFERGLKHVVEPYARYTYISPDAGAARSPAYDEIDRVALDWNRIRLGVRNRVYGAKGKLVLDGELYQDHSFQRILSPSEGGGSRNSPVSLLVRLWPASAWSGDLRLRYNVVAQTLDSQSLSVAYKPRRETTDDFIRLTYLKSKTLGVSEFSAASAAPASEDIRLASSLTLADGRLTLTPFLERDLQTGDWRQQRLILWYRGSCFSLGIEAGRRTIGDFRDTHYRFLVSLKGAGRVVDLNGGTSSY